MPDEPVGDYGIFVRGVLSGGGCAVRYGCRMVVKTIVHFEIAATDTERLAKFYETVFGWEFTKAPDPSMEYWLISTGPRGKSVGGGMYRKSDPKDGPRNYVNVDDIDAAITTFKAAGGKEVVGKMQVPDMGWSFIGADPEGNPIAMFQPAASMRPRPKARPRPKK